MSDFKDDLMAARFKLTVIAPYYARVAYAVKLVPTPGLDTLGVDKDWRLYYDPDLDKGRLDEKGKRTKPPWTTDELVAVLAHEMNHLLRDHAGRCPPGANNMAWNIAGDAEINDDLKAANWQIPKECVFPNKLNMPDNLTAEEYFKGMEKQAQDGPGDGSGIPIWDDMPGGCGSAADGKKREHEAEGISDGDGLSHTEQDLVRRQVAKDVKDHKKATGRGAADLDRWADEILEAQVDWRKELASLIRNAFAKARGKQDYTYVKPNFRRGWSKENPYIMPGTYQPVPKVAVVVDTSGSISKAELTMAIAEINGICTSMGASQSVSVIACDAHVHSVQEVWDARQISKLKGGGGTDMGQGIEAAEKLKAQVTVVVTDGYTPWPSKQPRTNVVVALLGSYEGDLPAWARMVHINGDK